METTTNTQNPQIGRILLRQLLPVNINVLLCWIAIVSLLAWTAGKLSKISDNDVKQTRVMQRLDNEKVSRDEMTKAIAQVKTQVQFENGNVVQKLDGMNLSIEKRDKEYARAIVALRRRLEYDEALRMNPQPSQPAISGRIEKQGKH